VRYSFRSRSYGRIFQQASRRDPHIHIQTPTHQTDFHIQKAQQIYYKHRSLMIQQEVRALKQ
jgi:hypothetical protein